MVSLRSPNSTGGSEANPTHFCGGILISASTVLTGTMVAREFSNDHEATNKSKLVGLAVWIAEVQRVG